MKRGTIPLLLTGLLLVTGIALAQSGGSHDLTWNTVDGGGGTLSVGGSFGLGGTIGQPDAGLAHGGAYALMGGFWPGAAAVQTFHVYLPLVCRGSPPPQPTGGQRDSGPVADTERLAKVWPNPYLDHERER